jgi:hypothetical protein
MKSSKRSRGRAVTIQSALMVAPPRRSPLGAFPPIFAAQADVPAPTLAFLGPDPGRCLRAARRDTLLDWLAHLPGDLGEPRQALLERRVRREHLSDG